MQYEWDENKRKINLEKHGFDFIDAWEVLENPNSITMKDVKHSKNEYRRRTIGLFRRRVCVVIIHTNRNGDIIRIIVPTRNFERRGSIMAIARYTTEQLKKMKSQTDWKRVLATKDQDIDLSDSPDLTEMLERGELRVVGRPKKAVTKKSINLRLDPEIIEGFKKIGPKWQTLINNTLREWLQWRSLL